jgi:hypothetical protein
VLPKGSSQHLALLESDWWAVGRTQLFSAARVSCNNTLNFPLKEKE